MAIAPTPSQNRRLRELKARAWTTRTFGRRHPAFGYISGAGHGLTYVMVCNLEKAGWIRWEEGEQKDGFIEWTAALTDAGSAFVS